MSYEWSSQSTESWLHITPAAGMVSETPISVSLSVDTSGLSPGTFNTTVTFSALVNGVTVTNTLPMELRIDNAHKLLVSDVGIALTSTPELSKLTESVQVFSNHGASIAWSATSDQPWLSVTASGTAPGNIEVSADPAGLEVDTLHYANVSVTTNDPTVADSQSIRIGLWIGSVTPDPVTRLPGRSGYVVVDPIRPYMYTNEGSYSIVVTNIYTGSVVTYLTSDGNFSEMTISDDGGTLYVAQTDLNYRRTSILPINLDTFEINSAWEIGAESYGNLVYTRSNGVGVIISGNGKFFDPITHLPYDTTFPITSNVSVERIAVSRDGNMFCKTEGTYIPFTLTCYPIYVHDTLELGDRKVAKATADTGNFVSEFALSRNGGRLYVVTTTIGDGGEVFAVFDAQTPDYAMPEQTLTYSGVPSRVHVAKDGRIFLGSYQVSSTANDLWILDRDGAILQSVNFSDDISYQVQVSSDGLRIISGANYNWYADTLSP